MNIQLTGLQQENKWNSIRFLIFSLFFFFFPLEGYVTYYVVLLLLTILLLLFTPITFNTNVKLLLFWLGMVIFAINFRTLIYDPWDNYQVGKEYSEAFRVLLPLAVLMAKNYFTWKNFKIFLNISLVYLVADFYFTGVEFFRWPENALTAFVKTHYTSERMANFSYLAKGLSPIGAEHGLILNLLLILYISYLPYSRRKWLFFLASGICVIGILASGSRTHMIATAFFITLFLVNTYMINRKGSKRNFYYSLIFFTIPLIVGWAIQSGMFDKMMNLSRGLNDQAYSERLKFWNIFLDLVKQNIELAPIGWGKTIFILPQHGFFTDNDYLTIFLTMGPVVLCVFLFFLLKSIATYFFTWNNLLFFEKVLFYFICTSLLMSWASMGFSGPRWALFFVMLINFSLVEKDSAAFLAPREIGYRYS